MLATSNAVSTSSKRAHHAPYPRCQCKLVSG